MLRQVTLSEAQTHLPDLVEAVKKGETVLIAENNLPVARLVPVKQIGRHPQFGSARGLIAVADDFDAPIEDFGEYMK